MAMQMTVTWMVFCSQNIGRDCPSGSEEIRKSIWKCSALPLATFVLTYKM